MKAKILAGALAALISTPALATNPGQQHQGQQQDQIAEGGSTGPVDVDQGGDKTETGSVIAVAPPSFSYGPGSAVGQEVITNSYAVGFPVIGGGFGEQGHDLTPAGIATWAEMVGNAFTTASPTPKQMLIKGYACVHNQDVLRAAGIVCEKN